MIVAMMDKTFTVKDLLFYCGFILCTLKEAEQKKDGSPKLETGTHCLFVFIGTNESQANILLFPIKYMAL